MRFRKQILMMQTKRFLMIVDLLENQVIMLNLLKYNLKFTAVGNKTHDFSSSVKKTDDNTKISEAEKKLTDHNYDKYIILPKFNF